MMQMLDLSHPIFVYSGSVDMRKSINGLCILAGSVAFVKEGIVKLS